MDIPFFTADQARVLGTLLEKSLATPDYYPMTLSALKSACNQKTCREPVSDLDDASLLSALAVLKREALVVYIPYGSTVGQYKYKHFLDDLRHDLPPARQAILSVLLLRGAQTVNEIKIRTASQFAFPDLAGVEAELMEMASGPEPWVEKLEKRTGWKEPRWRHSLYEYGAGEAGWISGQGLGEGKSDSTARPGAETMAKGQEAQTPGDEVQALRDEVAALHREMRDEIASLRAELLRLKESLGG